MTAGPGSRSAATPKHAPHAPRVPFALLVVGLLVGGLALLLALNTFSAANELQRNGLADQDTVIAAQVQDLRNQVAASAAPANIARAAIALGMVPAGNPAFLVVGADGTVRVMGKPAPVEAIPVALPSQHTTQPAKKPKPTSSKSATSSTSSRSSAKSTATPTSKSSSKAASKSPSKPSSTSPHPSPSRTPTATPTPTPVVTLPGGPR